MAAGAILQDQVEEVLGRELGRICVFGGAWVY